MISTCPPMHSGYRRLHMGPIGRLTAAIATLLMVVSSRSFAQTCVATASATLSEGEITVSGAGGGGNSNCPNNGQVDVWIVNIDDTLTLGPHAFDYGCTWSGIPQRYGARLSCYQGNGCAPEYGWSPEKTIEIPPRHVTLQMSFHQGQTPSGYQQPGFYDVTQGYSFGHTTGLGRRIYWQDAVTLKPVDGGCDPGTDSIHNIVAESGTCIASVLSVCPMNLRGTAIACEDPAETKVTYLPLPPASDRAALIAGGCALGRNCPTCQNPVTPGRPINVASGDVSLNLPLFSVSEPVSPLTFVLTYHSLPPKYPSLAGELDDAGQPVAPLGVDSLVWRGTEADRPGSRLSLPRRSEWR